MENNLTNRATGLRSEGGSEKKKKGEKFMNNIIKQGAVLSLNKVHVEWNLRQETRNK